MVAAKNWDSAATSTVVASGTADVQGVTARPGLIFMGVSATETAATAASAAVEIRHGTSATDPLLMPTLIFTANQDLVVWLGPNGVLAQSGIFVDRLSGTTTLVIYHNQEE